MDDRLTPTPSLSIFLAPFHACLSQQIKDGHHVEIVTNLKGTTIICTHASPDMYNSIDQAAHALQRKLRQYKERRQDGWHGGAAMGDDLLAALESLEAMEEEEEESTAAAAAVVVEDDFVDPDAPTVIKVNSFALDKAISVQEAVFALDYVDHDFYVFRNEETDKITVVYKRKIGGVGLIEP
jgi:putative sigma-54 modulation protein